LVKTNLNNMKNIYNMIYTIDNTKGFEEDIFEVETVIEIKNSFLDIDKLLNSIEFEPDKRLIDNILARAL